MKKKEEDEGRAVDSKDPIKDEPCTKMTMRLRRNLSSSQFVSVYVPVLERGSGDKNSDIFLLIGSVLIRFASSL